MNKISFYKMCITNNKNPHFNYKNSIKLYFKNSFSTKDNLKFEKPQLQYDKLKFILAYRLYIVTF